MATTGNRKILVDFTEDIIAQVTATAVENTNSPGQIDIVTLTTGANTITPPTGGATTRAVTIIPPVSNTNTITLKGVTGDTGVVLHLTDPTSIGLNSSTNTFVLTAAAEIVGVRLVWS